MRTFVLFCAALATISALPITVVQDGQVQLDLFAQMVATHWHFDHLDSIVSKSHHDIAVEFEQHINIQLEQQPKEPSRKDIDSSTDISLDLDMLRAQMLNAIQSHTEESLPVAWDTLADKLSRHALETHVRDTVLESCSNGEDSQRLTFELVSYSCLEKNAETLTAAIDQYVTSHLGDIFQQLDEDILPNMLVDITQSLEQVLTYFNQVILADSPSNLRLEVKTWQPEQLRLRQRPHFKSTFRPEDHHPTEFFSSYASMTKVSN